ncbi:hypothetical protein PF004_g12006 [Phytophthora fragariae]|uniref:Dynein heavy chain coiled coil stalk domain-containing protein n=1 Tax=Phytophthora fragariae TaxID=53985 RepID=A0A6G0NWM6_9STRA|nr:hypothetical protein PF004_g12006 [Phytophthora fragariae]
MCSIVHTTSNDFGDEFLSQLQRYVYTTPKSYLDLIGLYLKMLQEKRAVLQTIKNRMEVGVKKLEDTNSIVDSLKSELIELQPILAKKAVEAEELLKRVSVDQKAAAIVRERVSQDEATVTKQAEEVSIVQADAQKDLDVAMPALNNSIKALDSLSKNDITEVKSFAKPPEAVETVMNAVCLLFNEKQSWDSAKKILGDVNFLDKLKNFDKDNIPAATLKKLSKAVSEPGMAVEVVSKVSKAATSLCMWVHAMDVYSKVAKEVGPKKENLERMNQKLAEANAILGQKQEELRVVNENVAMLEKQCKETLDEKDKLANDAAVTEKRLVRAEKLISGLSVEGARWKESVASLAESILALIGDTFLAAACISYYGPFTGGFRQRIVDHLQRRLTNLIDFQTRYIYVNICRGLFEVHKVLFSMLICCKILLHSGKISAREWSFYLRGAPPGADRSTQQPNPQPSHISEAQWDLISELETVVTSYAADGAESGQKTEVHGFQGLCTSLTNVWPRWLAWLEDSAFLSNPNSCPGSYGSTLTAFQKVLLLRGLAEEKVPQAVLNMISTEMGAEFGRNATTTMEEIYNDTDRKTPCIFVLSAGADPTGMLLRFAKEMSFIDRLHLISLGQGQELPPGQVLDAEA